MPAIIVLALFIIAKLAGFINLGWFWVITSPIWLTLTGIFLVLCVAGIVLGSIYLIFLICDFLDNFRYRVGK